MEVKELLPAITVLLMTGLILGVGVLILDKFGESISTPSTSINETVTLSSGQVMLAYGRVTSLTELRNGTNRTTTDSALILGTNVNLTGYDPAYVVTSAPISAAGKYNVTYNYLANTTSSKVLTAVNGAIAPIASTWMGLLVTIIVLSMILYMVVRSFGQR